MEKVSPQVRVLALVLVLVGVAGMLAMRMLGPSTDVDVATATPVVHRPKPAEPVVAPKPAAKKASVQKTATPAKKAAPAARKPAVTPAVPKPKPQPKRPLNAPKPSIPPTGFPKAVDRALAEHEVVVVSLVVPGARVDQLAAAEAQAGAKLGGVGYLALNVLNEDVAHALLTKLDSVRDPSVLVLTRSGEVALQLNGFVDRETVAQAAANASS
jgi:outer membrane biosynthesis protein TonB